MATPQVTANTGSPPMAETERRVARMPDRIFAVYFDAVVLLPGFVAAAALSAHWNHIPASGDGTLNLQGGPALEAMFLCILIVCVYSFLLEGFYSKTLGKEMMFAAAMAGRAELVRLSCGICYVRLMQSD
jgi:hypothetical protein